MRIKRREFVEILGGSIAGFPALGANSAAQPIEHDAQTAHPSPIIEKAFTVSGGGMTVEISSQGNIFGAVLADKALHLPVQGETALVECELRGEITSTKLPGGGVEFRKPIAFQRGYRTASMVERFLPTPDSVRWEIEIQGEDDPWATLIETRLKWPEAKSTKFWTSWGDDFSGKIVGKRDTSGDAKLPRALRLAGARDSSGKGWCDPTVPRAFREMDLSYGGHFFSAPGFSVPIATVIDEAKDSGVSLALSPEDTLIEVRLKTDPEGSITFSRSNNKISKDKPVRFAMNLIAHAGDWRPGLGWMVKRYPDYFNPANSTADDAGGGGAYSAFTGDLDAEKFKQMGFRVNWLASFDWPYLGMYLPPVPQGTEWTSWYHKTTSTRKIDDYCRRMRADGFHVLCYFNVTEFGTAIKYPEPPSNITNEADLWKDPNAFLYKKLASSILYAEDGKPMWTWYDEVAVDPGDAAFQNYIVDQAARHVKEIPNCSGIAIDRMDRLMRFNYRSDDGVTWLYIAVGRSEGRPARSLINSWKETLRKIGPIMHDAGKAIYGNSLFKRLDVMREVDGIFDEIGYFGFNLNQNSFLGVRKPVIAWTAESLQLRPDPDEFFQRHLFMVAFPMVPYPENDHSILPDEWSERFYKDYGPLLDELRGRKWVLEPHVIAVEHAAAKANIFETPKGYALPITFGGKAASVRVILRGLPVVASPQEYKAEFLHPGATEWSVLKSPSKVAAGLAMAVPLRRGCAMVRLTRSAG
ncbi:MAG: hypothetical protein ABSF45_28730 [Terriglobia bacterium]|jgi:hypothetical protein